MLDLQRYVFSDDAPPKPASPSTSSSCRRPAKPRRPSRSRAPSTPKRTAARHSTAWRSLLRSPEAYTAHLEDAFERASIPAYFEKGTKRPDPRDAPSWHSWTAPPRSSARRASRSTCRYLRFLGSTPTAAPIPPEELPPGRRDSLDSADTMLWRHPLSQDGSDPAQPLQLELFAEPEKVDEPESQTSLAGSLRAPWRWEKLLVDAAVIGSIERWERRLAGLTRELEIQLVELDDPEGAEAIALRRERDDLEHLKRFGLPLIEQLAELPSIGFVGRLARRARASRDELAGPPGGRVVDAQRAPTDGVGRPRRLGRGSRRPERTPDAPFAAARRLPLRQGMDRSDRFRPRSQLRRRPRSRVWPSACSRGRSSKTLSCSTTSATNSTRDFPCNAIASSSSGSPCGSRSVPRPSASSLATRPSTSPKVEPRSHRSTCSRSRGRAKASFPTSRRWSGKRRARAARDSAGPRRSGTSTRSTRPSSISAFLADALRRDTTEDDVRGTGRYLIDVNPALARSLRAKYQRGRSGRFTAVDGFLEPSAEAKQRLAKHRLDARAYSVTALEKYAGCPYRFLSQRRATSAATRRGRIPDAPRRADARTHPSRRAVSHLWTPRGGRAVPRVVPKISSRSCRRSSSPSTRSASAFHEELAPAIERIWRDELESIRFDLRGWLRRQAATTDGFVPFRREFTFGMKPRGPADPASTLEVAKLANGLRLRGAIDLVEKRADGKVRVTDHKSGKVWMPESAILNGGESLQPVLYTLAYEALTGEKVESARLYYCTERGGYAERVVHTDEEALDVVAEFQRRIDEVIEDGFFPASPLPKFGCRFCDYLTVCGPRMEIDAKRKQADPRLSPLNWLRNLT